jgi:predicted Zn-dependent peptidase
MKKFIIYFIALIYSFGTINAQDFRSKSPQPGPAPKIQIGKYTKFELPNGLKVFVIENHRIPKVSYSLSLIITPGLEGPNAGIGSVTSELIGTGTTTRTKNQINEETDFIAGRLNANAEGIYASSLKKHTEKLLDLMSDVTLNSVFKNEELEKIRTQYLSSLASSKDDPAAIAGNVSSAVIYGKKHPYGEFETEASIKNINLEMCNQYYKKYFRPNVAYLSIVGDITPAEAKKLVEKYFGTWQKGEIPAITYAKPTAPAKTKVILVDRPASVQSVINVCYPVDLNLANPDYIKVKVANTILGGGTFRLYNNLREKHGYTYGAYSNFSTNPLGSSFKASTNVRNAVTDSAINQILAEMKRMRDEPVPVDELQMIKNYLSGNFALSLENPQTIASFATNTERYNLPKDFYANYMKSIEAVSAADIQAVSQKYLTPDQANILVVGKASIIADPLKKLSLDGKIEYLDNQANTYDPSTLTKPVPAGVTAQSILDKYIETIGGKTNIEKIKDMTMNGRFTMQGMKLSINVIYKIPSKYLNEIGMNGQIIQKQLYNGGVGKVSGMQGNKDMQGEELERAKLEAELIPELKYIEFGYKTQLKEISKVGDDDAYVIEITSPSGSISQDFFSLATGLKIKTVSTIKSPMGEMTQSTELKDYTDIEGVKMPKKMIQSAGGQNMEITLDSVTANTGVKDEVFN